MDHTLYHTLLCGHFQPSSAAVQLTLFRCFGSFSWQLPRSHGWLPVLMWKLQLVRSNWPTGPRNETVEFLKFHLWKLLESGLNSISSQLLKLDPLMNFCPTLGDHYGKRMKTDENRKAEANQKTHVLLFLLCTFPFHLSRLQLEFSRLSSKQSCCFFLQVPNQWGLLLHGVFNIFQIHSALHLPTVTLFADFFWKKTCPDWQLQLSHQEIHQNINRVPMSAKSELLAHPKRSTTTVLSHVHIFTSSHFYWISLSRWLFLLFHCWVQNQGRITWAPPTSELCVAAVAAVELRTKMTKKLVICSSHSFSSAVASQTGEGRF